MKLSQLRPSPRPQSQNDSNPGNNEVPPSPEYARYLWWLSALKSAGVMLVAVVVASISAWRTVMSEAKANSDAGIAQVEVKAAATQRELERFQREIDARINRNDAQGDRMEKKFDVLLNRLNVRNPAPAPKEIRIPPPPPSLKDAGA